MNLTKKMKDRVIDQLIEKAFPPAEGERLLDAATEALQDCGPATWREAVELGGMGTGFTDNEIAISFSGIYRNWRNPSSRDTVSTRLQAPYAKLKKKISGLGFSRSKDGTIANTWELEFGTDVIGPLMKLYDWYGKREALGHDLEALFSTTSSPRKLIEALPEAEEAIRNVTEKERGGSCGYDTETAEMLSEIIRGGCAL